MAICSKRVTCFSVDIFSESSVLEKDLAMRTKGAKLFMF
jgi:hypothetical protein